MTLSLPRYVRPRNLASGQVGFYWIVPTHFRRLGCTIPNEPLGHNYAEACGENGIGGRAAEAVGKKLKALSKGNQVLCVTHLPQIATFADHHYVIEKREAAGRAKTTVRQISGEERTEEVARMLSGAKLTETSRKHAEQMLKTNA